MKPEYKCDTCIGCEKCADKEFKGVYRCENYAKGTKENEHTRTI